jgi:hypothetical protein
MSSRSKAKGKRPPRGEANSSLDRSTSWSEWTWNEQYGCWASRRLNSSGEEEWNYNYPEPASSVPDAATPRYTPNPISEYQAVSPSGADSDTQPHVPVAHPYANSQIPSAGFSPPGSTGPLSVGDQVMRQPAGRDEAGQARASNPPTQQYTSGQRYAPASQQSTSPRNNYGIGAGVTTNQYIGQDSYPSATTSSTFGSGYEGRPSNPTGSQEGYGYSNPGQHPGSTIRHTGSGGDDQLSEGLGGLRLGGDDPPPPQPGPSPGINVRFIFLFRNIILHMLANHP